MTNRHENERFGEITSVALLFIFVLASYGYHKIQNPESPLPSPLPTPALIRGSYEGGYLDNLSHNGFLSPVYQDEQSDVYQINTDPTVYVVAPTEPDFDPNSGIDHVEELCEADTITWYPRETWQQIVIDPDGTSGTI